MSEKIDTLDFLITVLKEHETKLDEYSHRMSNSVQMLDRIMGHSLAQEKLDKLEELVEFMKVHYGELAELRGNESAGHTLKQFDKILNVIRT